MFCEGPELDGEILNEVSRFGGRKAERVYLGASVGAGETEEFHGSCCSARRVGRESELSSDVLLRHNSML